MATPPQAPDPKGADALAPARAAFARRAWTEAHDLCVAADAAGVLGPDDLVMFAKTANLLGRDAEWDALAARAHQAYASHGDVEAAAQCAFWLGFELTMSGESARGSAWLARATRLLDEAGKDSVVHGYLLALRGIRGAMSGGTPDLFDLFSQATAIAQRFNDATLLAFSRLGLGRVLIRTGRSAEGVPLLDDVMLAVTSGEVDPMSVGRLYCVTIDACHEVFDLRRAQEWTDALGRWYDEQPDLASFRGICLIHRAEMMQLHGAWPSAMDEARRACEWLADPPGQPAAGSAFYRRAELLRLRGAHAEADAAYREATESGRQPHPGLALSWLAQGRVEPAAAAIRRLLPERQEPRLRVAVLQAAVEIMLAVNDVGASRSAIAELSTFAKSVRAPYLDAAVNHDLGAVLLAEDKATDALTALRDAWTTWRELGAPFEVARTRVLIARAHRALGDAATATLELEAARRVFEELGAGTELARVTALSVASAPQDGDPLTPREREVIVLVATGKTNRAIAAALSISEKTVARHVSNIFVKLDLSSRAAATAYAYQHKLLWAG